ncbi:hypothetical protein BGZ76_007049, partial [Entomortierella beljakovae]
SPPSQQLESTSQDYNALSLSLSQSPEGHPPLARTRTPNNRRRYSFKTRAGSKTLPPPAKMKQYVFKPYRKPEGQNESKASSNNSKSKFKSKSRPKPKPKLKTLANSTAATRKLSITRMLAYHHPTSSLKVGTLAANVKRVSDNSLLHQEVIHCIRDAVHEAAKIKREGQRAIGKFVEHISKHEPGHNDRQYLDYLCPRVTMKDVKGLGDDEEDEENEEDEDGSDLAKMPKGGKDSKQNSFLSSFLIFIYSGNRPRNSGIGSAVNDFIDRLIHLKMYTPPPPSSDGCRHKKPFTPSHLVQSISTQLRVELKKMYKNGSCDLYKM